MSRENPVALVPSGSLYKMAVDNRQRIHYNHNISMNLTGNYRVDRIFTLSSEGLGVNSWDYLV